MAYEQLNLQNQICFRLYTVSRLVIQAYRPYLEPLGITYPRYLVLMLLWEHDHRLVGDIAKRLVLETNTVTPLIQRMEKEGIVVRERGTTDTRQRVVSLTEKGRQLEEEAKNIPVCLSRALSEQGASLNDLTAMAPTLDTLIDILKEQPDKQRGK